MMHAEDPIVREVQLRHYHGIKEYTEKQTVGRVFQKISAELPSAKMASIRRYSVDMMIFRSGIYSSTLFHARN